MEQYISKIDTERFGFKIAKIDYFKEPVANVLVDFRENDVKMVIGRVKSSDIVKLNELENNGFRIMDVQVTYRCDIKDFKQNQSGKTESVNLRKYTENDVEQIVRIAEEAFDNYGHYAADAKLDRKKCCEIYKDWALRSCLDKNVADTIFVAELNGSVMGFATFKVNKEKGMKYASCGLGAVNSKYRGRGIYQAIINRALEWGAEENLVWEEYSCLIYNFSVNRSYINAGFKPVDSFITLHCWL